MDRKFNSVLSVAVIPQTVDLIAQNENLEETNALDLFYQSKTYTTLANEETKLWHYSPMTIYSIWKHEHETGTLDFPEE